MHNYHDVYKQFPANAVCDKDGKPLLSWRVVLLPYLDESETYKKFKLDEPWDGPNNKKLLAQMPEVFKGKGATAINGHQATFFRVFSGPGAAFEGNRGLRMATFTDGLSNTMLIVTAGRPVPWTKPDVLPFVADKRLPKLGPWSGEGKGFHALFADGSVHFIKKETDEKMIRLLITRNSKQVKTIPD